MRVTISQNTVAKIAEREILSEYLVKVNGCYVASARNKAWAERLKQGLELLDETATKWLKEGR